MRDIWTFIQTSNNVLLGFAIFVHKLTKLTRQYSSHSKMCKSYFGSGMENDTKVQLLSCTFTSTHFSKPTVDSKVSTLLPVYKTWEGTSTMSVTSTWSIRLLIWPTTKTLRNGECLQKIWTQFFKMRLFVEHWSSFDDKLKSL